MSKTCFELSLSSGKVRKVRLDNEEDWLHIDTVDFSRSKDFEKQGSVLQRSETVPGRMAGRN